MLSNGVNGIHQAAVREGVGHQQMTELVVHPRVRLRKPRQQQCPQNQRSEAYEKDRQPLLPGDPSQSHFKTPKHMPLIMQRLAQCVKKDRSAIP
jgi:hypothetical protein